MSEKSKSRARFLTRLEDETALVSAPRDAHVVDRLLEASLNAALGRRGMKTFHGEGGLAVVLEVPSASWVAPLEDTIRRIRPDSEVVGVVPSKRRSDSSIFREDRAARTLAEGKAIVVVTTDRRGLLPNSFLSAADLVADLETPTLEAVRRVIEATCTGSTRALKKNDLDGLALFHLAYAIRPGPARASIERLRAATRAKVAETVEWAGAPLVDDLQGYGEAKLWAQRVVSDAARLRAGEEVRFVSCLLAGPPGTGKTKMVQSIAKTAGLSLISTSVASWFSRSSGDLDAVVKCLVEVVDRAMQSAPALLFLDEIDAIPSRVTLSARGRDWWLPVITGCLLEIDRLKTSGKAVVLVAATNHPESLDPALLRPGRLDRTITIAVPADQDLAGIFLQYCGTNLTREEIGSVVEIVGSATGAQVVAWVEEARRNAETDGGVLGLRHLLDVLLPPDPRSPEEIRGVAIHEVAHAVVALARGVPVKRLSIISSGAIAGTTSLNGASMARRSDFETHLAIALAGRAADELFGLGADAGAEADLRAATHLAGMMRATMGLGDTLVHYDAGLLGQRLLMDRGFADAVEDDLVRAKAAAHAILLDYSRLHAEMVEQLITRRVLDASAIEAIERDWRARTRTPRRKAEFSSALGSYAV